MRQENVLAVNGTAVVTDSGPKTPIGDELHKPGDVVWVDGPCVYGNRKKSTAPIPQEGGIPSETGKYTVYVYLASYIHFVIYDLLTKKVKADIPTSIGASITEGDTVYHFAYFTCNADCSRFALLFKTEYGNIVPGMDNRIYEFDWETGYRIKANINIGYYSQIYRFYYDADSNLVQNVLSIEVPELPLGSANKSPFDEPLAINTSEATETYWRFQTFVNGELTEAESLKNKAVALGKSVFDAIPIYIKWGDTLQSNPNAASNAQSAAQAIADADPTGDYIALPATSWFSPSGPRFDIQGDYTGENVVSIKNVINDKKAIMYAYSHKQMGLNRINGDNYTGPKTQSDYISATAHATRAAIFGDTKVLRDSVTVSDLTPAGDIRSGIDTWISYVKCISTGVLTGESCSDTNYFYLEETVSGIPDTKDATGSYENVIELQGGTKLKGTVLVNDKQYNCVCLMEQASFTDDLGSVSYGETTDAPVNLKGMFPDAKRVSEKEIIVCEAAAGRLAVYETATGTKTGTLLDKGVYNSTIGVFKWGSARLQRAISMFNRAVKIS